MFLVSHRWNKKHQFRQNGLRGLRNLRSADRKRIEWTSQATRDWTAATMSVFVSEAEEAMIRALSARSVSGLSVPLREDGETYAFWFHYDDRQLYGKICLRPDGVRIKVISAHAPRKGDRLS